jgi:hypothetical protein
MGTDFSSDISGRFDPCLSGPIRGSMPSFAVKNSSWPSSFKTGFAARCINWGIIFAF